MAPANNIDLIACANAAHQVFVDLPARRMVLGNKCPRRRNDFSASPLDIAKEFVIFLAQQIRLGTEFEVLCNPTPKPNIGCCNSFLLRHHQLKACDPLRYQL